MVEILLLDGDERQREHLRQSLVGSIAGLSVIEASSPIEAITLTEGRNVGLAVLRQMGDPDMLGGTIVALRERSRDIPIVVMDEKGLSARGPKGSDSIPTVKGDLELIRTVRRIMGDGSAPKVRRRVSMERGRAERSDFYLDLVTHDVDNLHQGVMGYLEFMQLLPETTTSQKKILSEMLSLMRMATILLGNVRKDISMDKDARPMDLRRTLDETSLIIRELYPDRKITIDNSMVPFGDNVHGSDLMVDLFLHLMDFIVQRSDSEEDRFRFEVRNAGDGRLRLDMLHNGMPIPEDFSRTLFGQSDGGRARGKLQICKLIAMRLGGDITYSHSSGYGPYRGGIFTIDLKGA